MKRHGHLFDQIADYENLYKAFQTARKAKRYKNPHHIAWVENNFDTLAGQLITTMQNGEYKTSNYTRFMLTERGKEREIFRLPFWPDRVVHHAVAQILAPIWRASLITDTSASIPGRGIRFAATRVREWIRTDPAGTAYALQVDVRKFYPSIEHNKMVEVLGRKIKDPRVMAILEEVTRSIDVTAPGVGLPIGNYLSQWFANLYLAELDHWVSAESGAKHYHRYCDDIIIFSDSKEYLHDLRRRMDEWLGKNYRLDIKGNWQVFPITEQRGLDFVGYVFYRHKTLLRKTIKKRMIVAVRKHAHDPDRLLPIVGAYNGWASFGSTRNLNQKFITPGKKMPCH